MKINITGRVAGYSYAEGEQDIPEKHARVFLDAGKADLIEGETSTDYTVAELKDMDLSGKGESFFEGDDRKSVQDLA